MDTLEMPATPVVARPTARSPGPRHRAPLVVRGLIGLAAAGAALGAVALFLSDRAPGLVRALFGETARSLWARIDADQRGAIAATGATAQTDAVAHLLVWFAVALLLGLTMWSWRGLVATAAIAGGASVAVEFGQRRWATTRTFETSDLVANLAGVALGIAAATLVIAGWNLVGLAVERLRSGEYI